MSEKATKSATLALWRERKKKPQALAIPRKPADAPAPLSYGQQRLWFLQEMYPENPVYNYAETYRLRGNLNVEHLLKGLEYVAQRHDILRTSFEVNGEQVIQIIHDKPRFDIQKHDLQNEADQSEKIREITTQTARTHFDLQHGALTRIAIIKLAENSHLLVLAMHHIIGDRWSVELLQEDWSNAYQALQNGEALPENPLQIQYADYAYWQKNQTPYSEKDLNYWKEKLSGELPVLTLPTDYPEPVKPSFKGKYASKTFSPELSENLIELSKTTNTTLFVLLLTAYKILLHRYSGEADILVGTPFINRDKKELEPLIGFFNETLVLRSDLSENPRFVDLLNNVRQTVLDAFSHKNMPFETLVKTLQPERRTSANPLFRVMFLYYDVAKVPQFSSDLSLTHEPFDLGVAKFDLTLFVANKNGQLTAGLEYATDIFAPETIERMHTHLQVLLQGIVANPNQRIDQLPFLSEVEKQAIIYDWNVPNARPSDILKMSDNSVSILDLFQKNVEKTPNAVAVKADNQTTTYAALDKKSNALAAELEELGVKKNTFVGLLTGRSVEMMIGILGIMKAGGAYLPLDPEYPAERIEFMLKDADVPVIVAQEKYIENLPKTEAKTLKFEDIKASGLTSPLGENGAHGSNFAYIIYTSGSTGKPKGVPVTHQNLLDSTLARFDYYPKHPGCFLLLSSFAFDSSVAGIFWSVVSGGTLFIPPRRIEQDTQKLADVIYENEVTHTLMLPSLYSILLQYSSSEKLASLNTIMVAGEACPPSLVARHFEQLPQAKLYNEYGPTEATVWCTVHEMTPEDTQRVPIGKPTSNAKIYILDTHLQPVPVNVAGELYVGGSSVTQGYHRRMDLTESRFVSNPFSHTHTRIYRTGDLARYRADGTIDFLGRADRQVKIRGYRIEPDEIAEVIKQHLAVRDVVVTLLKNEQRLCAYFSENNEIKTDELRNFVKAQLPEYMLPSAWVLLEDFPRLPNGKINFNALPDAQSSSAVIASNYVAARNPIEQKLVETWTKVLNIQAIGIHDNFFEIGGDSILSIQIIAKARKEGLQLKANQLFEHQSIAELALFAQPTDNSSPSNEIYIGEIALTPIQHWFFDEHRTAPQHWNMAVRVDVESVILQEVIKKSVSHLIESNDALRLAFRLSEVSDTFKVSDIKASVLPPNDIHAFQYFDLTNINVDELENEIEKRISHIQGNLNLEQGGLFRVAYFECFDVRSNVIVFIAHHLIIDVVSWQILLDEFKKNCLQIIDNKQVKSTFKASTFKYWGDYISDLAAENHFENELDFWKKQIETAGDFPSDIEYDLPIKEAATQTITFELDTITTTALLQDTNSTYNTKTDEVLLTALVQSFLNYSKQDQIQIALERHGRDIFEDIDVTNTIGWFTSFFPLNILLNNSANIGEALKAIKEQVRAVPNNGIGYGILHYLQEKFPKNPNNAPIIFNYVGNQTSEKTKYFGEAKALFKHTRDPRIERTNVLEINAQIKDGKLQVKWQYVPKIHTAQTIKNLIQNFENKLRKLIKHCQNTPQQYTPSDFPHLKICDSDLQQIITKTKQEIAEIYPLSSMQNALLFHHLQGGKDEGLLHVNCTLEGDWDENLFKSAWQEAVKRHEALRSSIYRENIKQSVQIVFSEAILAIEAFDWRDIPSNNIAKRVQKFKEKDLAKGLDLSEASVNRLAIIRLQNTEYQLIWTCHHILLDGWSAAVILRDVFQIYTEKYDSKTSQLEAIPSYGAYLTWRKKQNKNLAQNFWKDYLKGFQQPTFIQAITHKKNQLEVQEFSLKKEITNSIYAYMRVHRITLNTLMQGVWAVLLSQLTGQDDVAFGTTVSGRHADLPNVDLMAGLFMNVLPVRVKLNNEKTYSNTLNQVQIKQLKTQEFSHIDLNEIIGQSEISERGALFDSLMVVENFPWKGLEGAGLKLTNLSGGITTTYPLTIVIIPESTIKFKFIYNEAKISKSTIDWLKKGIQTILKHLENDLHISEILSHLEVPPKTTKNTFSPQISDTKNYIEPQNQTQLELVQIWEEIFGRNSIGIQDDFFEMGGTSLMAVRLFSKIEEKTGQNLPPVTLLQHRTVEALSTLLSDGDTAWSTLVPLRATGDKPPLFCIHAGGGHVLFYKGLADNVPKDQPVYAVQAEGLDGTDFSYDSMEEMTAHYLNEIRKVQPDGPYHLLGMCFSNAVVFEMTKQLNQLGEAVDLLVIVDSAPGFIRKNPPQKKGRMEQFMGRFRDNGFKAITSAVIRRLPEKFTPQNNLQEKNYQRVLAKFGEVARAYKWQPHETKITLIRSQEHLDRNDKEFHIYTWEYLSKNELDIFHVPGTHDEIFTGEAAKIIANELYKRING